MMATFLTFSAFILAFFAFINSIIRFRLNIGFLTMPWLIRILLILGTIALCDILTTYFHVNKTYTGLAIFFLWNAMLVAIIIYLLYKLMNPVKFNKKNAEAYFQGCSHIIASGIETDIQQLTSEILVSIAAIFQYANEDNHSKTQEYAIALITLFSDSIFCKKIVKHNPSTLYMILETVIANCDRHEAKERNFIDRLILYLFIEPDSQLQREEPYYGLGRFGTFKKLIFGNAKFLRSEYRPLTGWLMFSTSDFNAKSIKKYFEVIEYSLEKYLKGDDNSPDIFYSAMNYMAEIIKNNIYNLKRQTDNELHASPSYNNLIACSSGLSSMIQFIINKANVFPEAKEFKKNAYSYHNNDKNIYGALANGIYEAIEAFSIHHIGYESIRFLLLEIYPYPEDSISQPIKSIQERLDILLENKIEQNLTRLLYPAVTASLIYFFGLCEPENAKLKIHKFLLTELKGKFIRAHSSIPEVALDMLPTDTTYNAAERKLIRKHSIRWIRNKETEELNLSE